MDQEIEARRREAAAREQHRSQKRASIKAEIDAADLFAGQYAAIVGDAEAANAHKDDLASRHCEQAAPLQARLKQIEAEQIAAIKARRPADAAIEAERAGLLDQIRAMNVALEAAIKTEDDKLAALERERRELAPKINKSLLISELHTLARPDLSRALRVAQSAERWAVRRRDAANEISDTAMRNLELADAEAAIAVAQSRVTKALQAILDE